VNLPTRIETSARAAREADEDRIERVVELFVERYAKPKTKDWRETAAMLNREVVGRWKGRRLSQITRADVHQMLDEIVDRGAPIAANRRFAAFRKMCKWAVARGIIDGSPCEGMSAPAAETKRERVLTDDELRLVWHACQHVGLFGGVVRLLVLTGARRDEVAGMEWAELDLDACTWTLPAARAKNKREHVVPLSDAALDIIKGLPRVEGRRFLFSTTGRTHVSGFSKAKVKLDAAMRALRGDAAELVPAWVIHDIRRTVATNLQKLGVRLEVTEAVLNHVSGSRAGIVGVYQRHDFATEKRAALTAWARRLNEIVTGEAPANVVELSKARG
jgi:integrase